MTSYNRIVDESIELKSPVLFSYKKKYRWPGGYSRAAAIRGQARSKGRQRKGASYEIAVD